MMRTVSWVFSAILLGACTPEPCSPADLAHGELGLHSAACAAERQAKFPNLSDENCMAELGCAEIINRCDAWVAARCQ